MNKNSILRVNLVRFFWGFGFLVFCVFVSLKASFANKQLISEVDYFSSLRATETNIRSGPGANYPIKFSYRLRGMPVRVVSEYDNWNEIEDFEGEKGWVSQSLLSKKRNLMVLTKQKFIPLFGKNDKKSRVLLHLENFVIGDYLGCVEEWCNVKVEGKKGWVKRSEIFGDDLPANEDDSSKAESELSSN